MQDFKNKVAVITGAASGIGRALAEQSAREGMKVVLADVEGAALAEAADALRQTGAKILPVVTDVSRAADVHTLADRAWSEFGGVHLLCNNAGVAGRSCLWEAPLADWEWVVGVNLWGVIHGVHAFVPRMLEQPDEGHIVNTASVAGLISVPGLAIYNVTKHAVVTLSETLLHELTERQARIGVSVLCPSYVNTRLDEAERNRPAHLPAPPPADAAAAQALGEGIRHRLRSGLSPQRVAEIVFAGIRERRFYLFTHPESKELMRQRFAEILEEHNPTRPAGT